MEIIVVALFIGGIAVASQVWGTDSRDGFNTRRR